MKLFDKPWLEIVNININAVIATSLGADEGNAGIGDGDPIEE